MKKESEMIRTREISNPLSLGDKPHLLVSGDEAVMWGNLSFFLMQLDDGDYTTQD